MLYLECEIRKPAALRESNVIAIVTDSAGNREQLEVELVFLEQRSGRYFLPVWGISQDHVTKMVQLQFPVESVGGTNRIWIPAERVFYQKEEVPA